MSHIIVKLGIGAEDALAAADGVLGLRASTHAAGATSDEGALTARVGELVALAIAAVKQCEGGTASMPKPPRGVARRPRKSQRRWVSPC